MREITEVYDLNRTELLDYIDNLMDRIKVLETRLKKYEPRYRKTIVEA